MIIKDKFTFQNNKNVIYNGYPCDISINLYKTEKIKRLFFSARGDADIFLDVNETEKFRLMLEVAISKSSKNKMGFSDILLSHQLGDFSKEVLAVIQVGFANQQIGIGIYFEDSSGGDEIWLSNSDAKAFLNELIWLNSK